MQKEYDGVAGKISMVHLFLFQNEYNMPFVFLEEHSQNSTCGTCGTQEQSWLRIPWRSTLPGPAPEKPAFPLSCDYSVDFSGHCRALIRKVPPIKTHFSLTLCDFRGSI